MARNASSIGLFNFAHSYASTAAKLQTVEVKVTHWNAPIYFLYFHAVELYLKACLLAKGMPLETLEKVYGHKVRKLERRAEEYGLKIAVWHQPAISLMEKTDAVISSRYLRTGLHQRLPLSLFDELCRSLHQQIGPAAYTDSGNRAHPGSLGTPTSNPRISAAQPVS